MQLKNGDIFAEHYQLKKLLGVGSFGEVWLARNILADVDVAIKLYGLLDDNGINYTIPIYCTLIILMFLDSALFW